MAEPPEVVLVLGYRGGRGGRPSAVQRWRVDLAMAAAGPQTTLVMTGAGGEAEAMRDYAVARHRLPPARTVLETAATNTWENIANSLPLIEPGSAVVIASNPWHARRAGDYWCRQAPERCAEVMPGAPMGWRHPLLVAHAFTHEVLLKFWRYRPPA